MICITDHMWCVCYDERHSRGQTLNAEKVKLYKSMQQWCLENCAGRWVWSLREGHYFIEMGGASSVGWHQDRDFFLSIENEEDAVHFRLAFDIQCNVYGYRTKQQIIDEVREYNEKEGWKAKEIAFGS